jgi:hypothetical protein
MQSTDYKTVQSVRDLSARALQSINPHLVPVSAKTDSLVAAAKNIRIELKAAFPSVKFSVKSERFSGGDSIDVRWIDGPTEEQVETIIDKYKGGSFDGMTDCYNAERSTWTDAFGDADYVMAHRDNSDRALESAIRTVCSQYELAGVPTVAQYNAGALYNVFPLDAWNACLQTLIGRTAQKRTWALNSKK